MSESFGISTRRTPTRVHRCSRSRKRWLAPYSLPCEGLAASVSFGSHLTTRRQRPPYRRFARWRFLPPRSTFRVLRRTTTNFCRTWCSPNAASGTWTRAAPDAFLWCLRSICAHAHPPEAGTTRFLDGFPMRHPSSFQYHPMHDASQRARAIQPREQTVGSAPADAQTPLEHRWSDGPPPGRSLGIATQRATADTTRHRSDTLTPETRIETREGRAEVFRGAVMCF